MLTGVHCTMPATILVVDDEEGFRQMMRIVLGRAGYAVIEAYDGENAQEILQTTTPDLVLLDEMMPGISGSELCQQIKQHPELRHTPVLMFTASAKFQNPSYAVSIGADGVLLKPCPPREVLDAIVRFIEPQA